MTDIRKLNKGVVIDDGRIEPIKEFLSPEELYQDLISRVRKYHPSDDISMIEKAYQIANLAHQDQVRKSGEPYIIHPLYVAIILADLELDKETIVAGILHDVVEDTILTDDEIKEQFGADVALLVDGVTKLQQLQFTGENADERSADKTELQAENLRKMFLAMAKDIRVIMIKLADRLHNMRTLKHMPPEKQQRIARETLEIYSPIAQRLGISKIKVELDDLSLKYLEPEIYYDLAEKISVRKAEREQYVENIVDEVREHIESVGIRAQIDGRVKHFFSIYKKMKNQGKTIDQIYDLFAVRIIVDSVKDCYAALGVIHEMYKPIPGRFKDYIAMPKANMYQSLHTTLIGSTGQPFEIQIRTVEMHKTAEYGIAAHWKYKEASDGKKIKAQEEEKLSWLRQILEWQKDMSDNREFLNLLKSDLDLFSDNVYCFTPTGDVKNLPAGSTPIDFAYSIHSAVGNKMIGARVNGKLVTIDYEIKNGDRIEVITSHNSKGPSRDWLSVVKSTQAKNKINQWFKNEYKDDNIVKGKELLQAYCKAKAINTIDIMKPPYMDHVMKKYGFHDWEAVLAAVGHGGLKEGQIINKMQEMYERDNRKVMTDEQILAEVHDNAQIKQTQPQKSKGG
ncbi:MAG: bifunctional (p)ppGpp synthetase/guanosine-3',5'-bis(diphosphate) 3'-pyrophosphohydrolase, partial [Lachnospiraceae bacterium]|nr:bifunctional (p)ppGpp synthetase/guanosine-3',5'-bis(diphosphate) 3'-pyrophosphohydrolase [Lachnospiraceae bacterium]